MEIVIQRRRFPVPILPAVTAALMLIALISSIGIGRIQANQIGVFVNNLSGEVSVVTTPGATLYNGWMTDFYALDNTEQSYTMTAAQGGGDAVRIKTSDGADVDLDVAINYRLVADAKVVKAQIIPECGLDKVVTNTGVIDAYKLKWVRDFARSIIRYKFGELTPNSFYVSSERDSKAQESKAELNRLLNPHGITVTLVAPQRFTFYQELEDMIAEKKSAEQEVEAEKTKAVAAIQAQEREKTKATATKNVAVAAMDGELLQAILKAEADAEKATKSADAYAYGAKTLADAEFYKAQNDAKSILARATAAAEGLRKLAASLQGDGAANLVKMKYAEALQRARINGVPYATDPRIQKVQIDASEAGLGGGRK